MISEVTWFAINEKYRSKQGERAALDQRALRFHDSHDPRSYFIAAAIAVANDVVGLPMSLLS